VIFDRLIIDMQGSSSQIANTGNAFRVVSPNAHHIRFSNGELKNANDNLVQAGGASNIEVINNKIHDAYLSLFGGSHPTTSNYGLYFNAHSSLIDGNTVYDNTGYGLQLYHSGGTDVNDNIIRNNRVVPF
jgi:parallel beta-helix repeat protein